MPRGLQFHTQNQYKGLHLGDSPFELGRGYAVLCTWYSTSSCATVNEGENFGKLWKWKSWGKWKQTCMMSMMKEKVYWALYLFLRQNQWMWELWKWWKQWWRWKWRWRLNQTHITLSNDESESALGNWPLPEHYCIKLQWPEYLKAPWMRVVGLPSLPSRYALTRCVISSQGG